MQPLVSDSASRPPGIFVLLGRVIRERWKACAIGTAVITAVWIVAAVVSPRPDLCFGGWSVTMGMAFYWFPGLWALKARAASRGQGPGVTDREP